MSLFAGLAVGMSPKHSIERIPNRIQRPATAPVNRQPSDAFASTQAMKPTAGIVLMAFSAVALGDLATILTGGV